ncbi:MAG TPA: AAA family ATPase [Candidatus Aquilonibacter sp.]|jgi:predicted kinase|nr:AAA family ATPase [Candidatus Aquilonibacter sp.]
MRKWMRERLQRRKKNTAAPTDQPAAPPLQPAYFDAEGAPAAVPEGENSESEVVEPQPASEDQAFPEAQSTSEKETSETEPGEARPSVRSSRSESGAASRNRRRRGGRGRGGRGREQAVAQAFAPAAAKGSIPPLPVEPAEDEMPEAGEPGEVAEPVAAEAAQIPTIPTAAPRPPKGVVVLAIGLPGSGKSSWFKRHNVVPLSSDMVRSLLFDDVREQRFQDLVFSNLRSMLKARLIAKRPTNYVDATNLTPQERQHWIKLAKDYHYEVHAVFFDVPLEVCVDRHQRRDRVVPEDVMRRMAAKLKPPAFDEGFAKITVVRVKKKDPEAGAES